MKFKIFFSAFLLLTVTFFTSCEKYYQVRNGVVQIEMIAAPEEKSLIASDENATEIEIKFSSDTEIEEAYVHLFVEDENKFTITDDTVQLNDSTCLKAFPDTSKTIIIDHQNLDVGQSEYTFSQTVDLSAYPDGTCFVLFGSAKGTSQHVDGTEHKGIYFSKGDKN